MWAVDSCLHGRRLDEHGYTAQIAREDPAQRIARLTLATDPAPAANVSNNGAFHICC
jgi:hypothetical protein